MDAERLLTITLGVLTALLLVSPLFLPADPAGDPGDQPGDDAGVPPGWTTCGTCGGLLPEGKPEDPRNCLYYISPSGLCVLKIKKGLAHGH